MNSKIIQPRCQIFCLSNLWRNLPGRQKEFQQQFKAVLAMLVLVGDRMRPGAEGE
jgi:hypothetical protein